MSDATRATVANLLKGLDRYNPQNLEILERYVALQVRDNTYDLEANLAVLKSYKFNPQSYKADIAAQILLKALTNLPHTDFTLCRCLIDLHQHHGDLLHRINQLASLLETCEFQHFWHSLHNPNELDILSRYSVTGFKDSIRKFVCHVLGITYQTVHIETLTELLGGIPEGEVLQWAKKYGWKVHEDGNIFIAKQDEIIKPKNITEKITFDSVAAIMTSFPAVQ